jgi:hypothetical protein
MSMDRPQTFRAARFAKALLLVAGLATLTGSASAGGLFTGMAGAWRGEGSMGWTTGETEHVRCQATYKVDDGGNTLTQDLTCATDSTRLIIKSEIKYNPDAGAITGSWRETSYGIGGFVTGRASTGNIQAQVKSADNRFSARVTITSSGSVQKVTITPADIEVTEVSVEMRRSGGGDG